jgi:hypothetical protein
MISPEVPSTYLIIGIKPRLGALRPALRPRFWAQHADLDLRALAPCCTSTAISRPPISLRQIGTIIALGHATDDQVSRLGEDRVGAECLCLR